jgi:hypothetical protein
MILRSIGISFVKFLGYRFRSMHCLGIYAAALLAFTSANAAQQLTVTAANALRNSTYNLPLSASGLVSTTQQLNADGASHGIFDALVWAPNSVTGTLDLIVADGAKGQIVRYPGPPNSMVPLYPTSSVIFAYTTKGSGPAHPVGLSVDNSGNLFVVSPNNPFDSPSVWVLPFNATTGSYGAPVLIDHNFGGVRTLALAEVLIAGTAATAPAGGTPAWNVGDLLVLVGDTFNSRVMVYSQASINSVLANPSQPLTGPTSTAVLQGQFSSLLAVPFGMDIWPADATHGVSLLFTTIDGRILQFDSAVGAFDSNFASGLGFGLQKIKVGTNAGTPYAFVAQTLLPTSGQILQFGTPSGGSNPPLASVQNGVSDPIGMAVSSSDSTSAASCISPSGCSFLGGALTQQISGNVSNVPAGANILVQSCIIPNDPRVSVAGGTWSCLGPQMTVCSGTQTTNCVSPTLDVANFCPGFPSTVLPPSICGHSGSSGAGFEVVKSTAIALDQNANGIFIQTTVDPDVALPGPFNLSCLQVPIYAWAPRSDLPNIEGTIPEDIALPNTFIDLTGLCDRTAGNSKVGSMYAFGLGLNSTASGLGSGPTGGLFGFVTAKFANLTAAITAASGQTLNGVVVTPAQITGTVAATLQGYVNQSQAYFDSSYQSDVPTGYSCALNSLASADAYLRANLNAFTYAAPPQGNPNPAGDFDGRLANLFLTIDDYFLMQPPNTSWPAGDIPPCVTITASPASVFSGNASALSWGAASPAYPLLYPPAQCSLSASDGAFVTSTSVPISGTGVSTGALTTLGAYTAELQCTNAQGSGVTVAVTGLATTTVTVTPPPVLLSIAVTPNAPSIGDTVAQAFIATGTFSDGSLQNLTSSVTWSSSNSAIASISAGGSALCQAPGTVTISALSGTKQGSTSLTCLKVIKSLSLSVNGQSSVIVGCDVQITAKATYTDGTTAIVNSTATWSSSNPSVARVSGGLVKPLSSGQTIITASIVDPIAGTVSSTTTITVASQQHGGWGW